jgi:alpha-glucosidase
LLPYYYTLFYKNSIKGGTVIKSLAFEFTNDTFNNINSIDDQFLVGSALMISPVLNQGQVTVQTYLPINNRWFNFKNGEEQRSGFITLSAPLNTIPVHIRFNIIFIIEEVLL